MERRQFIGRIALLALAPWASGCGGVGGDTARESPPPAKSQLGRLAELVPKKGAGLGPKKVRKRR